MTNESTLSTYSYSVQGLFLTDMQQQYAEHRLIISIKTSVALGCRSIENTLKKKGQVITKGTMSWIVHSFLPVTYRVPHIQPVAKSASYLLRMSCDLLQNIVTSWMKIMSSDTGFKHKFPKITLDLGHYI
jgi:hypothetical protein